MPGGGSIMPGGGAPGGGISGGGNCPMPGGGPGGGGSFGSSPATPACSPAIGSPLLLTATISAYRWPSWWVWLNGLGRVST